MIDALLAHDVENYWGLFSGKFGQTGEPTFSNIKVTSDTIFIDTYTVNDGGTASLYDSFKVIKEKKSTSNIAQNTQHAVKIVAKKNKIIISGIEPEKVNVYASDGTLVKEGKDTVISTNKMIPGVYVVKAVKNNKDYYGKVLIK